VEKVAESYGRMIARLRKERGWTQQDLADHAGVGKRTVQSIEAGESKKPQQAKVDAIARALDIEGSPEEAARRWTKDIETFRDVVGAYLAALPEADRKDAMARILGSMFSAPVNGSLTENS
jgi:transcriptional regulator with XRE-family HTH domain